MKSILYRSVIVFVVVTVIATNFLGIFVEKPKQAQAIWPTTVLASIPEFLKSIWDKYIKMYWEPLQKKYRDVIVALVVSKLQRDIVDQINGGSGGGSKYVESWKDYLMGIGSSIAINEANNYVGKLSNGEFNLCVPFGLQIGSFIQEHVQGLQNYYQIIQGANQGANNLGADYYGLPTQCSISDIQRNFESLKDPNDIVRTMGLDALYYVTSAQVDPYILAWQTEDLIRTRAAVENQANSAKAQASQGFKPDQVCTDQAALAQAESTCEGDPEHDACVNYAVQSACTTWQTITPGSVLAQSIMTSVGANFQYSTNVQSALAAILNALISRVLREGLGHISSNSSAWAVSGSNQGIDSGDVPQNIQDEQTQANQQQLADAKKTYEDIIDYIDNTLAPAVNQNLALIQGFETACSSTTISIDQGGGTAQTMTIDQAYNALLSFQTGFQSIRDVVSANLDELNNIDYSDDTAVNNALQKYSDFANQDSTKVIVSDVQNRAGGQTGTLETMLANFNTALSGFSCPASQ